MKRGEIVLLDAVFVKKQGFTRAIRGEEILNFGCFII
jgi:hypothetical protein